MLIHETLIEVSWEKNQEDVLLFKPPMTRKKTQEGTEMKYK